MTVDYWLYVQKTVVDLEDETEAAFHHSTAMVGGEEGSYRVERGLLAHGQGEQNLGDITLLLLSWKLTSCGSSLRYMSSSRTKMESIESYCSAIEPTFLRSPLPTSFSATKLLPDLDEEPDGVSRGWAHGHQLVGTEDTTITLVYISLHLATRSSSPWQPTLIHPRETWKSP